MEEESVTPKFLADLKDETKEKATDEMEKKRSNQEIQNKEAVQDKVDSGNNENALNKEESQKKEDIQNKTDILAGSENLEKEKISCNVCQLVCENASDMTNHMTKEHKQTVKDTLLEPLHSCDQCDFDSEYIEDVKVHKEINIHNFVNHNKTFKETKEEEKPKNNKVLSCYLCGYETNEFSQMDEHGNSAHGIINCDKCEFCAVDETIMKQHMKKHTGRILFTCNICEFEASL